MAENRVEFWVVVGRPNSRKSSVIRALTGARAGQPSWEMTIRGMRVLAYVHTASLQEAGIDKEDLAQRIQKSGVKFAIFALQTRSRVNTAAENVDYFVRSAGWTVGGVALLGDVPEEEEFRLCSYPRYVRIPNNLDIPTNEIASRARTAWAFD